MRNPRVILVDPNRQSRNVVRKLLATLGMGSIREASDVGDALLQLSLIPADLVICEMDMAPSDGIDLVRHIRRSPDSPSPYVPVIGLVSHPNAERILAARAAGVHEIIVRPVSIKVMGERIASAMDARPFVRSENYFGPCRRGQSRASREAFAMAG